MDTTEVMYVWVYHPAEGGVFMPNGSDASEYQHIAAGLEDTGVGEDKQCGKRFPCGEANLARPFKESSKQYYDTHQKVDVKWKDKLQA